jgi:hypothetical protein
MTTAPQHSTARHSTPQHSTAHKKRCRNCSTAFCSQQQLVRWHNP